MFKFLCLKTCFCNYFLHVFILQTMWVFIWSPHPIWSVELELLVMITKMLFNLLSKFFWHLLSSFYLFSSSIFFSNWSYVFCIFPEENWPSFIINVWTIFRILLGNLLLIFFHKKNLSSVVKYFSIIISNFSFLWLVKFLAKVNCHTLPGTFFLVSVLELTHPRKSRSSCNILPYRCQLCARWKTPNYPPFFSGILFILFLYLNISILFVWGVR